MLILTLDELKEKLNSDFESDIMVVKDLNFDSYALKKMVMNLTEDDCAEAVRLINSINNQGIKNFYGSRLCYTVMVNEEEVVLGVNSLSHGEFAYLLGLLAYKNKRYIAIVDVFNFLTKKSIEKFLRLFKNNDYIIAVASNELIKEYYTNKLNELGA